MTTQPTHKGEVYTFHITPSTPEAHERIADGAEKPELLRGTLAQGRDLARLLNSPIDLLFGTGHTAFHINPDGRMPCETLGEAEVSQESPPPLSFAKRGGSGEVDWFCVGCRRPLWACDDDICRGHERRASGPIGGTTFCDGRCRMQTTSTCLERRKLDATRELLGDVLGDAAGSLNPWREWAAKILAAYPWVDEFKPDDSDEKYRDGVRYVLLCIECDGSGSEADNREMKAIRDRWGFS